jgi:hypothetical protein
VLGTPERLKPLDSATYPFGFLENFNRSSHIKGGYGELLAMTASPTPEQSARAIVDIFKSRNCYAGDPLEISYVKTQFLANRGSAADYTAGLIYAEDNGWLEVTPIRDMQPRSKFALVHTAQLSFNDVVGCRPSRQLDCREYP